MNPLLQHLLSAGFPGLGHTLIHRPVRAAVLASTIFYCLEGFLLSILIDDRMIADIVVQSGLAIVIFVWVFAHIDLFRIRCLKRAATEEVFVEGMKGFALGNLDEAEKLMRKMLLGDPYDIEARMYLALIYIERGALRAAGQQLKKCRRFDGKGVMAWETQVEMERLEHLKAAF